MLTANATAIPLPVTTKTCKSCNIEKPLSEFHKKRKGKHGVSAVCGKCEYMRAKNHDDHASRSVWRGMKSRCSSPNDISFKNYGGRGISVCERWLDFDNFKADMAPRPKGYQIDRIDNDAGYSPENCRWVTRAENCQNRRLKNNSNTGVTGVTLTKDGLYRAGIRRNGIERQKVLKQRWDAICQRKSWEARYKLTGTL